MRRVIPAMQAGSWSTISAIASRDKAKADRAAAQFGIPKAYGSYDELLADPSIDAVYVPLPNHLHLEWSAKAAEAGKHVLCEKPIGMNAAEARELLAVRDRTGVKIGEAFMVRTHPRWLRARELVRDGAIGRLRAVMAGLGYFNRDPHNIRNSIVSGGGALLDIGCYPVTLSRFLFDEEPLRVVGSIERDAETHTDLLTSAIVEFPSGKCVFTCSTQLAYTQWMQLLGTDAHIFIDRPVNPVMDRPSRMEIDDGKATPESVHIENIPVCNQFTIQGDLFSRAIREGGDVPVPLEDSVNNMAVIDAIFRSAESGRWETP